jgi:uncharacterized protein YndB with AHSA1/START domain
MLRIMDHATTEPLYDIRATTHIEAAPENVYRVASDITRMGEWSPECTGGEWTAGEPGAAGSRFRGHNRIGEHTWSVDCQVVDADPGHRFAWAIVTAAPDVDTAVWSFEIASDGDATMLTQRFVLQRPTEALLKMAAEKGEAFLDDRRADLESAMQKTVDGIKRSLEQ